MIQLREYADSVKEFITNLDDYKHVDVYRWGGGMYVDGFIAIDVVLPYGLPLDFINDVYQEFGLVPAHIYHTLEVHVSYILGDDDI